MVWYKDLKWLKKWTIFKDKLWKLKNYCTACFFPHGLAGHSKTDYILIGENDDPNKKGQTSDSTLVS